MLGSKFRQKKDRKVILYIATSVDGYIAREDGAVDWLFHDGDYGYADFYKSVDTILMGRKTYSQIKTFSEWPYPGKECIVFSKMNPVKDKNVSFSFSPVITTKNLKKKKGGFIWLVGGSQIIYVLLKKKLIDYLVLSIHPIVLGKGIPLFKGDEAKLELLSTKEYNSGLVQNEYRFV